MVPRLFCRPPVPRALQVGSPKPGGPEGRGKRGSSTPKFPDETRTSTFFFFYKMYSSSLELKNKSMYKTGSDQAPLTHSQTPADFLQSPPRRDGPRGGSQRVGREVCSDLGPVWSGSGWGSGFAHAGSGVSCPGLATGKEARISKFWKRYLSSLR